MGGKKASQPETLGQAKVWEIVKATYRHVGLCEKCAAQAAWGHQIGFALSNPPCDRCLALVATFPDTAPGQWRRFANPKRLRSAETRLNAGLDG